MDKPSLWKRVTSKLRRDAAEVFLAPAYATGMVYDATTVFRPELDKCSGKDLAVFAKALVMLAQHEASYHHTGRSVVDEAISIVRDLGLGDSADQNRGDHFWQAVTVAFLAAGYNPDDDMLPEPDLDTAPLPEVDNGY